MKTWKYLALAIAMICGLAGLGGSLGSQVHAGMVPAATVSNGTARVYNHTNGVAYVYIDGVLRGKLGSGFTGFYPVAGNRNHTVKLVHVNKYATMTKYVPAGMTVMFEFRFGW